MIYPEGDESLAQIYQRSCGCPIFQGVVELLDLSNAKRWKEIGPIKKKKCLELQ